MSELVDHLIWLVHFPATQGYVMVFVSSFGLVGVLMRSFRRPGAPTRLQQLRAERHLELATPIPPGLRLAGHVMTWGFRLTAVALLVGGVFGILGLTGSSPTYAYIHEHGIRVEATLDDMDQYVTFTATDGRTYTLPFEFFTPSAYPDERASLSGERVIVRYLESHPQAYVVDTDESDTY